MTAPHYTTRDFYLASFVLSEGGALTGVKRLGPKRVEFRFVADRWLHQLLRLYWSGEPVWVKPIKLFSALKELKSLARRRP